MTLQDYIQKDIERLELMKRDLACDEPECSKPHIHERDSLYNKALQTIIDIKRKELEELNEHDT